MMPEEAFFNRSAKEVLAGLQTDAKTGLSETEAQARFQKFGANRLAEKPKPHPLLVFLQQFNNFVVWILLFAAIIAFVLGETIDAAAIFIIVFLNAVFGYVQENKAEQAMAALKKMSTAKATVVRDAKELVIDNDFVVPGDIVLLNEGDLVAADCRLIESVNLKTNEAGLTGESHPVEKKEIVLDEKTPLAERCNMLYGNTTVVFGRGRAVVIATGMQTEFGKIAQAIQETDEAQTPLAQKLDALGAFLGKIVLAICVLIFGIGLVNSGVLGVPVAEWGAEVWHTLQEILLVSVSLAVAAIPEGLPAVVTITLAIGMSAMAARKAIIRKMSAVETLGSTSVICSDKTGTLTRGELAVTRVELPGQSIGVTGSGYSLDGKWVESGSANNADARTRLVQAAVLCNNASMADVAHPTGDPTEIALIVLSQKAGQNKQGLLSDWSFVAENGFDSDRKRMSVVYRNKEDLVFCKGSAESVLSVCSRVLEAGGEKPMEESGRKAWLSKTDEMSEKGLRVLAFAYKSVGSTASGGDASGSGVQGNRATAESSGADAMQAHESDLVFVGLVGMIDTARPEAREAIKVCHAAGIDVKMITGDHPLTAKAIAIELGLLKPGQRVVTGNELDAMDDEALARGIDAIGVFARVSPSHKVRVVQALQKKDRVVAMTGDGVNDAPALKKADIGVAMGISGTEVSKQASEMVLSDDNFATIVGAVEEGRRVYANIRAFVKYLLSANTAEVLLVGGAMLLSPFLGWPVPLLPIHLLFLNLVTDGLPALALGNEKALPDNMKQKPRPKWERVEDRMVNSMAAAGFMGAFACAIALVIGLPYGDNYAQTFAFATLVVFELVWVFECRHDTRKVIEDQPFSNRDLDKAVLISFAVSVLAIQWDVLHPFLKTTGLRPEHWFLVLILGLSALFAKFLADHLPFDDWLEKRNARRAFAAAA